MRNRNYLAQGHVQMLEFGVLKHRVLLPELQKVGWAMLVTGFPLWRPRFDLKSGDEGFVVDK